MTKETIKCINCGALAGWCDEVNSEPNEIHKCDEIHCEHCDMHYAYSGSDPAYLASRTLKDAKDFMRKTYRGFKEPH